MANFNRVILMGNLTKDPELRYTAGGAPVANLRMAINRVYQSKTGEKKEDVCYVTVVVWNKLAETVGELKKKGDPIFVEGRFKAKAGKPRTNKSEPSWKSWRTVFNSSTVAKARGARRAAMRRWRKRAWSKGPLFPAVKKIFPFEN